MRSRVVFALLVAIVAVATIASTGLASAQGEARGVRLNARLAQAADIDGVTPRGHARYRAGEQGPRNLIVHVRGVNLPAGTSLQVNACDGTVGWITLQPGRRGPHSMGRLRLRVRAGDAVPVCEAGDEITVAGAAVDLTGTLDSRR